MINGAVLRMTRQFLRLRDILRLSAHGQVSIYTSDVLARNNVKLELSVVFIFYNVSNHTFLEAAKIRGVGEKMADKIAEILNYGSLQKVKEVCSDEKTTVLELFNRSKYELYKQQHLLMDGTGLSRALVWYVIPSSML